MQTLVWNTLMAVMGGALLALMIHFNSKLALETTALNASWIAHGLGGVLAFSLYRIFSNQKSPTKASTAAIPKLWYLGGLPGGLTVILASITVNSALGLSATLALGLIGQFVFSIICEVTGLFGLQKRTFNLVELLPILLVAAGSIVIISQKI